MKKVLLTFLLSGVLLMGTACAKVESANDSYDRSMLIKVEKAGAWMIVDDKETKVMYVVSTGTYNYGNFTVLVNADGTPKIYESEDNR